MIASYDGEKSIWLLLDELDNPNFLQCNRATVVNTDYIRNIDLTNCIIELKNGLGRLEIGVTFKNRIKKFLSE